MKKILTFATLLTIIGFASAPNLMGQATGNCNNPNAQPCNDSQTITASGSSISIPAANGGLVPSFEEIMTGAPSTVSVVISGCMAGGTCDVLDTNTTVGNAIRSPIQLKVYSRYSVTATWTGGTGVSVQVNTMITTASNLQQGGRVIATLPNTTYSGTASVGPVTLLTTTNAGVWEMCYTARLTVAGSAGTFQGYFNYTDATVAHTNVGLSSAIGAASTGGTVTSTNPPCQIFHADANTQILYGLTASSVTDTPTIQYSFTLIFLQFS